MNGGEEAPAYWVHSDAEESGVGREGGIGDDGVDYSSIRDGEDCGVTERANKEVLSDWVPRKGLWVEVG